MKLNLTSFVSAVIVGFVAISSTEVSAVLLQDSTLSQVAAQSEMIPGMKPPMLP